MEKPTEGPRWHLYLTEPARGESRWPTSRQQAKVEVYGWSLGNSVWVCVWVWVFDQGKYFGGLMLATVWLMPKRGQLFLSGLLLSLYSQPLSKNGLQISPQWAVVQGLHREADGGTTVACSPELSPLYKGKSLIFGSTCFFWLWNYTRCLKWSVHTRMCDWICDMWSFLWVSVQVASVWCKLMG